MERRRRKSVEVLAAPLVALFALVGCAGVQRPADLFAAKGAEAVPPGSGKPGEAAPIAPDPMKANEDFGRAVRLTEQGDLSGAASLFERAFEADHRLCWALVNAGALHERLGEPSLARADYERALAAVPDFGPAAIDLARLRIRTHDLALAEREIRERMKGHDLAVGLRVALAEVLLSRGDATDAELELKKALKVDEKNVAAMVELANVYTEKKRYELARMVLDNARQIDPSDATVYEKLAFVDLSLFDRAQALEEIRTAIALRPDYGEAQANYGALLVEAEDYEGARSALEVATRLLPENAQAFADLGNAYRGARAFDKAEAAYDRAASLDPSLLDVPFNLGLLYLDGDKPGMSLKARVERALSYFDAYEKRGGQDVKIAEYRREAAKAVDRETKRLAREEKDRLRKEVEAKKNLDQKTAAVPSGETKDPGSGQAGVAEATTFPDSGTATGKKKGTR